MKAVLSFRFSAGNYSGFFVFERPKVQNFPFNSKLGCPFTVLCVKMHTYMAGLVVFPFGGVLGVLLAGNSAEVLETVVRTNTIYMINFSWHDPFHILECCLVSLILDAKNFPDPVPFNVCCERRLARKLGVPFPKRCVGLK